MFRQKDNSEQILEERLKGLTINYPEVGELFQKTDFKSNKLQQQLFAFAKLYGLKISYGLMNTNKTHFGESYYYKIHLSKHTQLELERKSGFAYYYFPTLFKAELKSVEGIFKLINNLLIRRKRKKNNNK